MSERPIIWNALFKEMEYGPSREEMDNLYNKPSQYTDDICKSLIRFSLAVKNNKYHVLHSQETINDARKEFELNGRICESDEDILLSDHLSAKLYDLHLLMDSKKLRFLTSTQKLAKKLRKVKNIPNKQQGTYIECVFCKNNNEPIEVVRNHQVRDFTGKVTCPILRAFRCPICGKTGDQAHTLKYCPQKPIITMRDIEMAEHVNKIQQQQLTWC